MTNPNLWRVVKCGFWDDDKVIDNFSPEDKLFMMYLLTNPHTTQLGIYHVNKRQMAFEIGYSVEAVATLLERFQNKYEMIFYDETTQEVALKNALRHNIVRGGKPVMDLLKAELSQVKSDKAVAYVVEALRDSSDINETVKAFLESEAIKQRVAGRVVERIDTRVVQRFGGNDNDNDNDNDNENISFYATCERYLGRPLNPAEIKIIKSWQDDGIIHDLVAYAIEIAQANNVLALSYINSILVNWNENGIKSLPQAKAHVNNFGKNKGRNAKDKEPPNKYFRGDQIKSFDEKLYLV